jgi:hypothetical protein
MASRVIIPDTVVRLVSVLLIVSLSDAYTLVAQ